MYHITKSKSKVKPFSVVLVGKNGEVLSQHPLETKQNCFKNIQASLNATDNAYTSVQDDTEDEPVVYTLDMDGKKVISDRKHEPKYIAGRNPKKKK